MKRKINHYLIDGYNIILHGMVLKQIAQNDLDGAKSCRYYYRLCSFQGKL